MSRHSVTRWPALVALGGVLVAAGLADRADRPLAPSLVVPVAAQPTAAPPDSLSSTWYCPVGTAAPGGVADATVVIFNPTDQVIPGALFTTGIDGVRGGRVLSVPARERVSVRIAEVSRSPFAATLVQLDRGGAIVEHTVTGPNGDSAGPCATTASSTWYFAEGSTARSASLTYALFNPFPDDAIVDVSFSTDTGRSAPAAFQGVVVQSQQVVALDVGSHVRRRDHVSAVVRARRGRVVAEALQIHGGNGRRGIALTLGATSPASAWTFADGVTGPGSVEKLHLFNPGPVESRVTVDLVLDDGEAEPFDLRVPPSGRFTLDLVTQPRVPKGVGHALMVRVDNGQPVVAQRTIDFGPPSPRVGFVSDLGSPRPAKRWAFAAGGATEAIDEWISVLNASTEPVRVRILGGGGGTLDPLPRLEDVALARGKRVSIRIAEHLTRGDLPLLVEASGNVYVERILYRADGGVGVSASAGVVRSL